MSKLKGSEHNNNDDDEKLTSISVAVFFHVCLLLCLVMGSEAKKHISLMSCRYPCTCPQEPNTKTGTLCGFRDRMEKQSALFFFFKVSSRLFVVAYQ